MILESFTTRKYVADDKLWEMIKRANNLTQGGFSSWDDNAPVLVPLLKRILARAREVRDWQIYFYVMGKALWYIGRDDVQDTRFAFQISEMFHQAYREGLAAETTRFGREYFVDAAARILDLYMQYPQIDDVKMGQMLSIFLECEEKYGTVWNAGNYVCVLSAALLDRDGELIEKSKKKLASLDFDSWCYICYYVRPMLKYYVYREDFDRIEELILSVSRKEIPKKYQWCYQQCEQANEETLVFEALAHCMDYGKPELFRKIFDRWPERCRNPIEGDIVTCDALLHALAGDLSRLEEVIQVAEEDDRKYQENKVTPFDAMYWFLYWHLYFRLLDRHGIGFVRMNPVGEIEDRTAREEADGRREYSCQALSEYFGRKSDEIGRQMSRSRSKFDYGAMKKSHEICLRL